MPFEVVATEYAVIGPPLPYFWIVKPEIGTEDKWLIRASSGSNYFYDSKNRTWIHAGHDEMFIDELVMSFEDCKKCMGDAVHIFLNEVIR